MPPRRCPASARRSGFGVRLAAFEKVRAIFHASNSGLERGGRVFSRGALYKILNNQLYLGEIHHRGHVYSGQQEAIIDVELWEKVAEKLKANNQAYRERRATSAWQSIRMVWILRRYLWLRI
jgi:hypothetical protein